MTILAGAVIALVAFCLGYIMGESGSYNKGYRDASDIYSVPAWTYKKTIKRKK